MEYHMVVFSIFKNHLESFKMYVPYGCIQIPSRKKYLEKLRERQWKLEGPKLHRRIERKEMRA